MESWNPMVEDYVGPSFNSFNRGIGSNLSLSFAFGMANNNEKKAEESVQLYIVGLPVTFTKEMLKNLFTKYGNVIECFVSPNPRLDKETTYGFITYSNLAMAENAIQALNRKQPMNLRIEFSKNKPIRQTNLRPNQDDTRTPFRPTPNLKPNQTNGKGPVSHTINADFGHLTVKVDNTAAASDPIQEAFSKSVVDLMESATLKPNNKESIEDYFQSKNGADKPEVKIGEDLEEQIIDKEICVYCGEMAGIFRCFNCKCWYCDQFCQVSDWPNHRILCQLKLNYLCSPNFAGNGSATDNNRVQKGQSQSTKGTEPKDTRPEPKGTQPEPKGTQPEPKGLQSDCLSNPDKVIDGQLTKSKDNLNNFVRGRARFENKPPDQLRKPFSQKTSTGNLAAVFPSSPNTPLEKTQPISPQVVSGNKVESNVLPGDDIKADDKVVVSYMMNPNHFWVHKIVDPSPLVSIMDALQKFEESPTTPKTPFQLGPNHLCLARFASDNTLYRARIHQLFPETKSCLVFFLDFGNSETVSELWEIPASLAGYAPQAYQCNLFKIKPSGDSWTPALNENFNELVKDIPLLVKHVSRDSVDPLSTNVVLEDEEGNNITELMAQLQLGVPVISDLPVDNSDTFIRNDPPAVFQFLSPSQVVSLTIASLSEDKTKFWANFGVFEIIQLVAEMEVNLNAKSDEPTKTTEGLSGFMIGDLVAARYDSVWYRGIITDSELPFTVHFIDYGNENKADFVHSLTDDERMVPSTCSHITVIRDDLKKPLTDDTLLNTKVIYLGKELAVLEWYQEENSTIVIGHLVARPWFYGLLPTPPLSEQEDKLIESLKTKPNEISKTNSSESVQTKLVSAPAPTEERSIVLTLPSAILNIGDSFIALVVWVESANKIYLTKVSESSKLMDLMINLKAASKKKAPFKGKPKVGEIVAARFEDDNEWYRAKVLQVNSRDAISVRFIDYGNESSVPITDLMQMPKEFFVAPFALCVSLHNISSIDTGVSELLTTQEWNATVISVALDSQPDECLASVSLSVGVICLNTLLVDQQEETVVAEIETPQNNVAEVLPPERVVEDSSLRKSVIGEDKIEEENFTKITYAMMPVATLPVGKTIELTVNSVTSPALLMCSYLNEEVNLALLKMMNELNEYGNSKPSNVTFKPDSGQIVLAKFAEDGNWYRAAVLDNEVVLIVIFIDYGNVCNVDMEEVLPLSDRFLSLPAQAIHCSLADIAAENTNIAAENWAEDAIEELNQVITNQKMKIEAEILSFDSDLSRYLILSTSITNPLIAKQIFKEDRSFLTTHSQVQSGDTVAKCIQKSLGKAKEDEELATIAVVEKKAKEDEEKLAAMEKKAREDEVLAWAEKVKKIEQELAEMKMRKPTT